MEQYYLTCLALALNINGDVNKKEYRYYISVGIEADSSLKSFSLTRLETK